MKAEAALALDVASRAELFRWVENLKGSPITLKIGLRLLPELEPGDLNRIHDAGFKIFIDAKLHDIPTQVAGAVKTWGRLGADFLTVHLSGGPAMLKAAQEAAKGSGRVELFGVSVLTSIGGPELERLGLGADAGPVVERWAKLGLESGLRAFVCSVGESARIHAVAAAQGLKVRTVCPGIRMPGEVAAQDQARVYSVADALQEKVGMLVLGRAVMQAPQPRARLDEILETLK